MQDSPESRLFQIAQKISTPLSLVALVVLVLSFLISKLLALPVFSQLGTNNTYLVLNTIVADLFILALVGLFLGIGSFVIGQILKYRIDAKKHGGSSAKVAKASEQLEIVDASIDEQKTAPVLDVTVRNIGTRVAILTRVEVEVLEVAEFYACSEDVEGTRTVLDVSRDYDVELSPQSKGKSQLVKTTHQLKPDEGDRLQLSFGHDTGHMAPVYVWYALKVTLLYNKRVKCLASKPFILSIPAVDLASNNVWEAGDDECLKQNKLALRKMAALKAIRSESVAATLRQVL